MKTLQNIAKSIKNSETLFGKQATKNYLVWVTAFAEFHKTDNAKNADLKAELIRLKISKKTVENRISMLNVAKKSKLDATKFKSFNQLDKANKTVKSGDNVVVEGKLVNDPKQTAKNMQDAELIKAQNENEIANILANADFKKFAKVVEKMSWDTKNIVKALAKK